MVQGIAFTLLEHCGALPFLLWVAACAGACLRALGALCSERWRKESLPLVALTAFSGLGYSSGAQI